MKKTLAAVAALTAIFSTASVANAQQTPLTCGKTDAITKSLSAFGEKLTAIGSFMGTNGALAKKLQEAGIPTNLSGVFEIYSNKTDKTWTALIATVDGSISCSFMNGDELEIQNSYTRAPGIPASFREETALEKLEHQLLWGENGGQSLQLKAASTEGELRIYANTKTGTFTVLIHDPETGSADVITGGDAFPALDLVENAVRKMEEPQLVDPAVPHLQSKPAAPSIPTVSPEKPAPSLQ